MIYFYFPLCLLTNIFTEVSVCEDKQKIVNSQTELVLYSQTFKAYILD